MDKKTLAVQIAQASLTAFIGAIVAVIAFVIGGAALGIGIAALLKINNYIDDTSIWIYELGADIPSTIPKDETLVTKGSKLVMNYVNETTNNTESIGGYTLGYPSTGIAGAGMQFCQSNDTDIEIYLEFFAHGFTKENMTCSETSPGLVYLERLSEDPTGFLGINTTPQCNLDVVGSACLQNLTVESLAINTTSNANCSLSVGGDSCLQDVLADTIGLGKVPEGNCTVDTDGAGCFGSVTIGTPLDAGLGADPFLLTVHGDATMQTALMDTANVTMNANIGIDAIVGNDLTVGNNASVASNLDVSADVNIGNDLLVTGSGNISNDLEVGNNLTVLGTVIGIDSTWTDMEVTGNLNSGRVRAKGPNGVESNLYTNDDSNLVIKTQADTDIVDIQDRPFVYLTFGSQQAQTANAAWQIVPFDSVVQNTRSYTISGGSITVADPGIYLISGSIYFTESAGGNVRALQIYIGTTEYTMEFGPQSATGSLQWAGCVSQVIYIPSATTVALRAFQDSGGNLNYGTSFSRQMISVMRLGGL